MKREELPSSRKFVKNQGAACLIVRGESSFFLPFLLGNMDSPPRPRATPSRGSHVSRSRILTAPREESQPRVVCRVMKRMMPPLSLKRTNTTPPECVYKRYVRYQYACHPEGRSTVRMTPPRPLRHRALTEAAMDRAERPPRGGGPGGLGARGAGAAARGPAAAPPSVPPRSLSSPEPPGGGGDGCFPSPANVAVSVRSFPTRPLANGGCPSIFSTFTMCSARSLSSTHTLLSLAL